MTKDDDKRRIRLARKALRDAVCSCKGKHDEFWVPCPRTMAEIDLDEALVRAGFVVW
jgi:hypothetical protein